MEWSAGVEESAGVGVGKGGIPFVEEDSVPSVMILCAIDKVSRDCVHGEESNISVARRTGTTM